ncbi:hypothetical protein C8Q76DRAFT_428562 [Earliella scabrosa]|nr:hypothetical protein C8Q76DRAFT_428562 [Earliella scabrosa]
MTRTAANDDLHAHFPPPSPRSTPPHLRLRIRSCFSRRSHSPPKFEPNSVPVGRGPEPPNVRPTDACMYVFRTVIRAIVPPSFIQPTQPTHAHPFRRSFALPLPGPTTCSAPSLSLYPAQPRIRLRNRPSQSICLPPRVRACRAPFVWLVLVFLRSFVSASV